MGNLNSNSLTFRLFKKKEVSFWEAASLFSYDEQEELYNYDKNDQEADKNSIQADWLQVGNDLRLAISEYEKEQTVNNK